MATAKSEAEFITSNSFCVSAKRDSAVGIVRAGFFFPTEATPSAEAIRKGAKAILQAGAQSAVFDHLRPALSIKLRAAAR